MIVQRVPMKDYRVIPNKVGVCVCVYVSTSNSS